MGDSESDTGGSRLMRTQLIRTNNTSQNIETLLFQNLIQDVGQLAHSAGTTVGNLFTVPLQLYGGFALYIP